ncbi:activated Cdc42 kinase-like isoform X3 [Trichoplusia ni]|uniref:non-specific protein-tyrosine kinase n=1 Tax=Trichoplusia ni TaxID=7111 RepID=A0A7E5VPL3_TRINI|nr:activated Cdc42 kinase-like isoform X3 [Trichoplusia ni]
MAFPESAAGVEDREYLNDFLEEAELQQYYELFRDILKVTKVSQLKFVLTEDLVQIGMSRPEQRRYKKIYSKYFPNPYISKIRKMLKSHKKRDQNLQGPSCLPLESQPFFDNNVKVPTKHIISIEDITINKELGMGQFGVVQQGTWTTGNQRLQVAIKCLGHERMTSNSTEFLKEAAVMHSIEHPNIVRLYGVVLHLDSLMLVTELAPLRSLLECLREVSLRLNFPVPNLCEFAEQICDGMTYLESKRLIHRDLAARNILVFSKDRVKISDFGLSRALGVGKDYYQTNYNVNLKLPVAWCAPECILFLRFTSASDVWAFGVCLWEMFTYGFQPWAAFSGQQILEAIDSPNFQRLERPECCPEAYYTTMLECWAHDFNNRPKFKDLGPKLRSIRPEQAQATTNFQKPDEGRRNSFLEYKAGQVITVLGKETMTKSPLWYGVLPGGACGMFDPTQTKPYIPPEKNVCHVTGTLSPNPTRHSARSIRTSLLRSDVKRHTYTGKRTIQRSMISSPQGDVKHTGHVGLDGAYFGDISFLDPAGCPPRQVVTPYKPSEDLEQVPLINPNSPSHLTGASGTTPYPMLTSHKPNTRPDCDEIDLSCESRTRSLRRSSQRTISEPTTSKSILSKVRCATLGRSHKTDNGAVPKTDEIHEYHEISDTDTEPINNSTNYRSPSKRNPDIRKSTDFSESLLEEMEEMFRTLDQRNNDESGSSKLPEHPFRPPGQPSRSGQSDAIERPYDVKSVGEQVPSQQVEIHNKYYRRPSPAGNAPHTMSRSERKKILASSTVKPMSAHDERTLNTAVALANEITSRSMTDLGTERKAPQSPNDRNKFVFKFPFPLHHGIMNDADKDKESTGRQERRNFSEEAKSVPDLQSTITEESKLAYTSLIEEPTPSTSMMAYSHASVEKSILKPGTSTKQPRSPTVAFTAQPTTSSEEPIDVETYACNVLPLPPRTNKPKLVDKPRHIRKYPLKLPSEAKTTQTELTGVHVIQPIIYQNTQADDQDVTSSVNQPTLMTGEVTRHPEDAFVGPTVVHVPYVLAVMSAQNLPQVVARVSVDETGTPPALANTNPFVGDDQIEKDDKPPMSAEEFFATTKARPPVAIIFEDSDEIIPFSSVTDDQVSVEDLLELNYRPCGRQSGLESDEVRIMCKVLKNEATAEDCLEALNVSDWDVHSAIKVARVKHAVGDKATFQECMDTLDQYNNDVITSITAIHVQDPSLT